MPDLFIKSNCKAKPLHSFNTFQEKKKNNDTKRTHRSVTIRSDFAPIKFDVFSFVMNFVKLFC